MGQRLQTHTHTHGHEPKAVRNVQLAFCIGCEWITVVGRTVSKWCIIQGKKKGCAIRTTDWQDTQSATWVETYPVIIGLASDSPVMTNAVQSGEKEKR